MKLAPVIAIYGPEGAGKSTTVAALQKYLQSHNFKAKVVFLGRGKNNIIPINKLGKSFQKKEQQQNYQQPIGKNITSLSKKIIYTAISVILVVDLLLRYCLQVFPFRLKGTIIICDRYSSDLYLMDKVPLIIRKVLLALFPKPAKTFYLYNTIKKLHQRKGRSRKNLQWQMKQFNFLNHRYKAIAIKTDNKKETLHQVIKNIDLILPPDKNTYLPLL